MGVGVEHCAQGQLQEESRQRSPVYSVHHLPQAPVQPRIGVTDPFGKM